MARLVFLPNPEQPDCLSGAFGDYVRRIPPRFDHFVDVVDYLLKAPYLEDFGSGSDGRCDPPQRSRIWPGDFNCWEASAHFAAEAIRLLPDNWIVAVQDKTIGTRRHVWPVLRFPALLAPMQPANADVLDVLSSVVLTAGEAVARVYGLGPLWDGVRQAATGRSTEPVPEASEPPRRPARAAPPPPPQSEPRPVERSPSKVAPPGRTSLDEPI